jgi:hypothetical protein
MVYTRAVYLQGYFTPKNHFYQFRLDCLPLQSAAPRCLVPRCRELGGLPVGGMIDRPATETLVVELATCLAQKAYLLVSFIIVIT